METFLFGPGDQLFGAYHEGFGAPSAPAVLICNGLGQDYMRSHLVLRHLARRLSAVGGPVLQFDYRGTGDSWGEPEGNTLDGLREDTAVALRELLDISARPRVVTLGVRLGAWLALEHGERVVAWDPILSGQDYVASLRSLTRALGEERHDTRGRDRSDRVASRELAGYRYADELLDALSRLDLTGVIGEKTFEHVALVTGDDGKESPARQALEGPANQLTCFAARPARWNSVTHFERSLTPFPSLGELCETVSRW